MNMLIERYYDDIYRYCYYKTGNATLSYDLAQETFLKMVRYLDTYREKMKFKAYLFTIALNICNDHFRKQKVTFEDIDTSVLAEKEDTLYHGRSQISQWETADYIQHALKQLPDIQKDAVILHYYYDYKIREIAAITGVSSATVKSRLNQGIKKLKQFIRKEDIYEG